MTAPSVLKIESRGTFDTKPFRLQEVSVFQYGEDGPCNWWEDSEERDSTPVLFRHDTTVGLLFLKPTVVLDVTGERGKGMGDSNERRHRDSTVDF